MNRIILFITFILLTVLANAQSDGCSLATNISVTSNCASPTSGTTVGATQTIAGCVGTADDDVWYSFVATSSSHNISVTGNGTFDAVVQLFSGGCSVLNSISCQDQTFGGGTETIYATGLTPGQTYTYRVYNYYSSAPGTFTTCVTTAAAPPSNDEPCNATSLAVNATCINTASTSVAATESMTGCAGNADDDVWFSFVATNSIQTITVDPSSNMDAVVQLFEGTCGSLLSLNCEDSGFTDGNEEISAVGLTPGNTYYIRVYDYYTATGGDAFDICVTGPATAVPSNDEPCTAIELPPVTSACNYLNFTTTGSTASLGAPTPTACVGGSGYPTTAIGGFSGTSKDVWFTITVPSTGNIYVTAEPAFGINDAVMALYSGSCGSLSQIACSDDHNYPGASNDLRPYISETGLIPGSTVYLRYWGWGSSSGDFGLCVTSPTNDDCSNALYICDLNGYSASTSAAYSPDRPGTGTGQMYGNGESNTGIFTSPTNTSHTGGPFGYTNGTSPSGYYDVSIDNNSWITFTASATTATLTVSIYDCWVGNFPSGGIQMEIFSGTNCDNFVSVSNFEESSTGFVITASGLTIGQDYYLMVDGYAGDICNYTITADSGVAFPEITATDNPLCSGETTILTAPSTATSYLWSPGGATTPSITVSPSTTTTYSCVVEGVCGYKQTLTYTVDVNQLPSLTTSLTNSVCSGTALNIPLTSNITSTYTWIAPINNTDVSGESLTTQTTSTITDNLINNTTGAETVNYTVTPTAISTGCEGTPYNLAVTVNPIPVMTSGTAATICSGTAVNIPLTSNVTSSYTWIATNNANTTGESTTLQSTSTINNIITNSTSTNQVVSYDVRPTSTAGSCQGSIQNVLVTVNPKPTMTSASSTSICTGATLNIGLTSNVASSYSWVATSNSDVSGESITDQSGSTINNTLTNNTTSPEIVEYTVTPTSTVGSCIGDDQIVNVTVNPAPTMTSATTSTICSGATLNIGLSSDVASNYSWVATVNNDVTGESTSATVSNLINNSLTNTTTTPQNVIYTVTPTSTTGSCEGSPQIVTATVNPSPTMTSSNSTTICSGETLNIGLTSDVASTYTWGAIANPNVTGESTSSQTGSTINNTLTNNTASVQTVSYSVYGVSTVGTCAGSPQTVTVTVNPLPTATANNNNPCLGQPLTLTGGSTGLSYSWSGPDSYTSTSQSPTVSSSAAASMSGVYTLTVSNTTTNCSNTATTNVSINALPVLNTTGIVLNNPSACAASDGSITGITGSGSPTLSYSWNGGSSQSATTLSGLAAGNYTLVVTDGNGCTASAGPFALSDPTPPTPPSISLTPGPVCVGGSFTISIDSPVSGATYSWSGPNAYSNTGNSITLSNITTSESGSYDVATTISGCTIGNADAPVTVNVNSLPLVDVLPPLVINCDNPTITLDGSNSEQGANISYNWVATSGGSILGAGTTDTETTNTAGDYELIVTNSTTGCENATQVSVSTNMNTPTAAITTTNGGQLDCSNTSLTLDGSGSTNDAGGTTGITYTWSTTSGGSSIGSGATQNVSAAGDYYLLVEETASGCTDEQMISITADANVPVAIITNVNDLTCDSTTITLQGGTSTGGTLDFNWEDSSPTTISTTSSVVINTAGTYTLTVTNPANSCTNTASITINEDIASPTVSIVPSANEIDCNNPTIDLDGSGSSQGSNFEYTWTTTGNITGATNTDNATGDAAGVYTLTVENTNTGCVASTNETLTLDTTSPSADAGNDVNFTCGVTTVALDGSNSSGTGISFNWTGPGSITGGTSSTPNVSATGTYTLTVTGANGCTDTDIVEVIPNSNAPTADAGTDIIITCNTPLPINLDGSGSDFGSNITYNWSTTGTGNIINGNTTTPTVDQEGDYTLTVTNSSNSCTASATVSISTDTVSPVADASATVSSVITCTSNLVTVLDGSNSSGTGLTYAWSTTGGTIDSQLGSTATVSTTGDYELEVTGSNGCSDITTISVTTDTTSPNIGISPSDTLNCNITTVTIDASASTGSNESYQWTSSNGTIVSGVNTNTVTVSTAGTYILTVTNDNGCTSIDSNIVNINPDPIAAFTPSVLTGSTPLTVDFLNNSIGNNLSNAWTFGDGNVSVDINPSNTYSELGSYTVELIVIDQFGCSDTAQVVIDASGDYTITIPNIFTPNVDGNNDIFRVNIEYATDFQATIFNRWGQLVYEWDGVDGGWDGYTYSGVLASEGTYYYLFIVTDIKGEIHEYQGHFRLAR